MSEEVRGNIISTADLGNGTKQVTLSVDPSKINDYLVALEGKAENIVISDKQGSKIASGSVMNRYSPTAESYMSFFTSNDKPYTKALKLPDDPHQKIKLAVEMYFKEPLIGTVVDLMVDFSSSGFTNECDDNDIKKLYDKWSEEVKLSQFLESLFLEYYRSGNVTIYRSDKSANVKRSKKSKDKTETQEYKFPAGYTVLNPMNVKVIGSLMFGKEIIELQLNKEVIDLVKNAATPKTLLSDLPTDIVKAIRSDSNTVLLNPDNTTRITRKRQPYERYAAPFTERVFESVLYKQKLRQMDVSTIEGLVNQLVTVTIGDKDFPATDEDLKAVAELFQTPNKAYTVFWNHTLKVTFHKPEGLETLDQDKYKQVNEDIMAGLGVSRVLLDGQGANFSTAWVSILSLIERLENARSKVKQWLEEEYKRIADENGFSQYPKVRFNRMNLREDTYIRDVLLAMYDRGLIDEEDILVETGRDYQSVVEMKKRNEKNKELFFPPEQPFQGGQTGTNDSGRPTGSGGKYSKRKTSPEQNKGKAPKAKTSKASLTALYSQIEEDYEDELMEHYDFVEAEVVRVVEENQDKDSAFIIGLVMATLISLFKSISRSGSKIISDTFDQEFAKYSDQSPVSSERIKSELFDWNNSYVSKLANDIKEGISTRVDAGQDIGNAVFESFRSHRYRVKLISQAGVIESTRQAKIQGNISAGMAVATWITTIDDATCGNCKGLHMQQFEISDIPPRPHSGCRCDLEFS